MSKKVVWVSDFDFKSSGYFNISIALCDGLARRGYDVKAVGLGYDGREHDFPFSIIPARNSQEVTAITQNLKTLWRDAEGEVEHLVVALDVPLQDRLLKENQTWAYKYTGLFPIEAPPLTMSWAMVLMGMDKQLVISEFGTEECRKAGVSATHLPVGINRELWRKPTNDERWKFRQVLFGVGNETTIVLTVADNQERKNLTAAMDAFKIFSESHPDSRYVLVTRKNLPVGYKLDDYAAEIGITQNFLIFDRGMPAHELWALYAASDMFLLTSKAEGLGMPLREAMSVGLSCVATNACGMKEQLADGRGFPVTPKFTYRDTFGNGYRYLVDPKDVAEAMEKALVISPVIPESYWERFDWEKSVTILEEALK